MTNKEAYEYWEDKYEHAQEFCNTHPEAAKQEGVAKYLEALRCATNALEGAVEMEDKIVAYICDQDKTSCRGGEPGCKTGGECRYTTDPAHAKNFECIEGGYWEKTEEEEE